MENNELTTKQRKVLNFVRAYLEANGNAPTIEELQGAFELSSPRAVQQYLEALEKKGYIIRGRYERRGIKLVGGPAAGDRLAGMAETENVPVVSSAGCDNMSIFAERAFDEYICVAADILNGRPKDAIVSIRAIGNSMDDAGINDGDYVLVEMTEAVSENDLIVAIIDSMAVIKKIQYANNAVILQPVSTDPKHKPIILNRNFKIFGKVLDVIRAPQKGDLEVIPLYESKG